MFWLNGDGSSMALGRDMEWVDDLVSPDPVVRAEAVLRFKQVEAAFHAARQAVWDFGDTKPRKRPKKDPAVRARSELSDACGRDLMETLWQGWSWVDLGPERFPSGSAELIHYSLRYLEWEAHFPAEWPKSWTTKQSLLKYLARREDLTEQARARLADLVIKVVSRTQHCKDESYIAVARAIEDESLRQRVAEVAEGPEPARARFLIHMLDHPDLPATTWTWQRWEAEQLGE
ncbi:MAG: hypothetical protein QOI21_4918 [Actinomycetota bacterium]|jgi:hypothetical protein|nr:hypothetical protein [Actinomycetota bacterium]